MATKTLAKRCASCEEVYPLSAFHRMTSARDGLQPVCKGCHRAYRSRNRERQAATMREWRRSHADHDRDTVLRRKYGITLNEYRSLLETQGGKCAICGTDSPKGKGRWHVDHDHKCCAGEVSCGKCVRGLLCQQCNTRVVPVVEDTAVLSRALAYVRGHRGH